jgi:hypothetical protein
MDEVQSLRMAKKLMFREHELKALRDMVDMYREEFGQDSRWLDASSFVRRLAASSRDVGEDEPV